MKFIKVALSLTLLASSAGSFAGCLDNLTHTSTVTSKVKGFYINKNNAADDVAHYVILDKDSCTATAGGIVEVKPTTKSFYYLAFSNKDQALFTTLLAAEAQDKILSFRLDTASSVADTNGIAYVVSPSQ